MLENTTTTVLVRSAVEAYHMSDHEMGSTISRIAIKGRSQMSNIDDTIIPVSEKSYLDVLFAMYLPEIAARLFERSDIHLGRRRDQELSEAPDHVLRSFVSDIFTSTAFKRLADAATQMAKTEGVKDLNLITSQAVNGNIMVLALDRLSPAGKDDEIGSLLRITGSIRGIPCQNGMWHPDMARDQLDDFQSNAGAKIIMQILDGCEELDARDAEDLMIACG